MLSGATKALLAQVSPLCKEGVPAAPQDLTAFWVKSERAIRSLDPSYLDILDPMVFTGAHVRVFGLLLSGPLGWQQLNQNCIYSWDTFMMELERIFGLSTEQKMDQFFALKHKVDKTDYVFVLHVEQQHR